MEQDYLDCQILQLLDCPVCDECMSPPIVLCGGGHSICGPCRAMVVNCPMCYRSFTKTRDFLLENVFQEMVPVPCPNSGRGCVFRAVGREVAQHAEECPHRDYSCPIAGCSWLGSKTDLRRHATRNHPRHLLEGARLSATIRPDTAEDSRDLLEVDGELFVASRTFSVARSSASFVVQLLGPRERCHRFSYEVRLGVSGDPCPSATFSFPVREDTVRVDEIVEERACVCVDTAFLRNFVRDGVLRYEMLVRNIDF